MGVPTPARPLTTPGSTRPGTGRALSTWLRAALLLAVLAAGLVVALTVRLPGRAELGGDLAAAGAAGPLLFVALYAVATLSPLPKTVLTALAGVLFGIVEGVALVAVAALLGATAGFFLGRLLGRDAAQRLTRGRLEVLDGQLRRRGLLAVVVLRLVPVVPFTTVNYLSGLTAVALRDFLLGTAVGILPTTTAYVALGAYGSQPGSWPFLSAVVALVLLSVGGLVGARTRRGRRAPAPRV